MRCDICRTPCITSTTCARMSRTRVRGVGEDDADQLRAELERHAQETLREPGLALERCPLDGARRDDVRTLGSSRGEERMPVRRLPTELAQLDAAPVARGLERAHVA